MLTLDEKMLHEVFQNYGHIITIEDGCVSGGEDLLLLNLLDNQYNSSVYRLGIPDEFIEHSTNSTFTLIVYDKKVYGIK